MPAAGDERAVCLVPSADAWVFTSRDREEELAGVRPPPQGRAARRPGRRAIARGPGRSPAAARTSIWRATCSGRAGIGYDARDTLPLAAEPFAAALDLVLEWIASGFTRPTTIALLRSPHFRFADADGVAPDGAADHRARPRAGRRALPGRRRAADRAGRGLGRAARSPPPRTRAPGAAGRPRGCRRRGRRSRR